jgi:hypothetical protein
VGEVVLPLHASVRAHARVEEDAARRGLAGAAESERERAVDELVAARPVGRPREEGADLRGIPVRIDARSDVDDDELADELGVRSRGPPR